MTFNLDQICYPCFFVHGIKKIYYTNGQLIFERKSDDSLKPLINIYQNEKIDVVDKFMELQGILESVLVTKYPRYFIYNRPVVLRNLISEGVKECLNVNTKLKSKMGKVIPRMLNLEGFGARKVDLLYVSLLYAIKTKDSKIINVIIEEIKKFIDKFVKKTQYFDVDFYKKVHNLEDSNDILNQFLDVNIRNHFKNIINSGKVTKNPFIKNLFNEEKSVPFSFIQEKKEESQQSQNSIKTDPRKDIFTNQSEKQESDKNSHMKKEELRKLDKRPLGPIHMYVKEHIAERRAYYNKILNGITPCKIMEILNKEWKDLSDEEKKKYIQMAREVNEKNGFGKDGEEIKEPEKEEIKEPEKEEGEEPEKEEKEEELEEEEKAKLNPFNMYVRENFTERMAYYEKIIKNIDLKTVMMILDKEWNGLSQEKRNKYVQMAIEYNEKT